MAVVGTIEPGLAILSTLGLLLLAQVPYNAIVVAMPFLVFGKWKMCGDIIVTTVQFTCNNYHSILAIGVNDMFIIISSWHNTNADDPPEKRFTQALSEAGVSITITSVTL